MLTSNNSPGQWDCTGAWEREPDGNGQTCCCKSDSSADVQNWESSPQRLSLYCHLVSFNQCHDDMQLLMKSFEFSFSQRKHIDSMMGFMCYYGHVQNTSNLGEGNVYKSYFLGALVEIPCWLVTEIFYSFMSVFFCFDHKVQIFTIGSVLLHLSLSRCDGVLSFCHLFFLIFFSGLSHS